MYVLVLQLALVKGLTSSHPRGLSGYNRTTKKKKNLRLCLVLSLSIERFKAVGCANASSYKGVV